MINLISGLHFINNNGWDLENVTAASIWTKTSDKDLSNGTLINLTLVGDGEEAELSLDLSKIPGWVKKTPMVSPQPRQFHAMAPIYNTDNILLFGGNTTTGDLNDTWIYNSNANTWTQIYPEVSPAPRYGHAMAAVDGDDKVVMFGGWSIGDFGTWIFDYTDLTWENKTPITRPAPRAYHAMATVHGDDKVLLTGGESGFMNYFLETWIYDLSDNEWTKKVTTYLPEGIFLHDLASVYGTDKIVHYGGSTGGGLPSTQTWVYDVSENNWSHKTPDKDPNVRMYHKMATIFGTDKILLFGGTNWGSSFSDDTWVYDLSENTWTKQIPKNKPNAVWCQALSPIYGTDQVVLFGGNSGVLNNDTWEFKYFLPNLNGGYISKPFDTKACSRFYNLTIDSRIPANTSIKLQVRTAQNLSELVNRSYVGPDGDPATFYNTSSSISGLWTGHNGDRYIQYKVFFNIFGYTLSSPALKGITISYNCLPEVIVLNPTNGSILQTNKPTFTWTFEDEDSESQKAFQLIIDDDIDFQSIDFDTGHRTGPEQFWIFPDGSGYKELPDGSWYWKVRTMDSDSAWTEYSTPWKLSIDTHAPCSTLRCPIDNNFYFNLNNISGESFELPNGTGLDKVEITIKCLDNNKYWNGTGWVPLNTWLLTTGTDEWVYDTSTIPWYSGYTYLTESRGVDLADNIEIPSEGITFMIDKRPPISKIDSLLPGSWVYELKTVSGIAVDIDDSGLDMVEMSIKCMSDFNAHDTGAKVNEYWNGDTWVANEIFLTTTGTEQWSFNTSSIPWATGDQYLLCTRAVDKMGNIELPSNGIDFYFDGQPPEPIYITINNDEEFTTTAGVNLSLHAVDVGSGVSEMSFSVDGTAWSSWEPFETARMYQLTAGDGNKSIYFRVRDNTGNLAVPVHDNITLDSIPPEGLAIVINNNDKYTNSNNVQLSLLGFDTTSGVSEMAFSYDGKNWYSWVPYETQLSNSLTSGDGEKKIYFRLRDKANNIAIPVTDSIILDTTPPHSLSIRINNGSLTTNSRLVSLQIRALDDTSGVEQISFSTDEVVWSDWENYSEVKDYLLTPMDGLKTIYFKVKDRAGNIAEPQSSSITLNTIQPQKEEHKENKSSEGFEFWPYLFLIIVLLIVIISVLLAIYIRNRRTEQKLVFAGILPIKPGGIIGPKKVPELTPTSTAAELTRLPGTSTTASGTGELGAAIAPTGTLPMLPPGDQLAVEITPQTTQQPAPVPAQSPTQARMLHVPRLPPAQNISTSEPVQPVQPVPLPVQPLSSEQAVHSIQPVQLPQPEQPTQAEPSTQKTQPVQPTITTADENEKGTNKISGSQIEKNNNED